MLGVTALFCAAAEALSAQSPPRVVGVFDGSTGAPLRDAEVALLGTGMRWRTSAHGLAVLANAPRGVQLLRVRRLGYRSASEFVTISAEDTLPITIALASMAPTLPEVRVEAPATRDTRKLELRGFLDRRRLGTAPGSAFWTREEIEAIGATRWSDLLMRVRGGKTTAAGDPALRCGVPLVILDGIFAAGLRLRDVPLGDVAGLELYSGPAEVPAQFNQPATPGSAQGCVAVVWTRDRS